MAAEAAPAGVRPVTTWHLDMRSPGQLRRSATPPSAPQLAQAKVPSPALNRFLYTSVGGPWHWTDRLPWTWERWMQWLDRPQHQTWVMSVDGTPAGYFELEQQPGAAPSGPDVEIAYFGIAPQFLGRGLGGWLLTRTIEQAWAFGAGRVWVHTCSLDHPRALANYQARGMAIFREETVAKLVPEAPGPWPGAQAPPLLP